MIPFSKLNKTMALLLSSTLLVSSCVSSTMIRSYPENANLRIDGVDVGTTPYRYEDSKIAFSSTDLQLTKDGYRRLNTSISKDEEVDIGPAVAGFFVVIPWLWALKYRSSYTFDLKPEVTTEPAPPKTLSPSTSPAAPANSKIDALRELKTMLDEGLITQEEYDVQKKKILAE
jgi:hypothetical protein